MSIRDISFEFQICDLSYEKYYLIKLKVDSEYSWLVIWLEKSRPLN